jgi:hypothetical protein
MTMKFRACNINTPEMCDLDFRKMWMELEKFLK